jgi:hypothetical protein
LNAAALALGALAAISVASATTGCGSTKTATKTVTVAGPAVKGGLGAPRQTVQFGYVKSLVRKDDRYVLRFDPAWFVSGITANTAAAQDGAVEPGQPVPNDNYVVNEDRRLFTYTVPSDARATVLTQHGNPGQLGATRITIPELAQIVLGKSHLKLFEPIDTGFWITIRIDTVRSLDQQYHP